MLTKLTHSFIAPKSMSSEKKNIELKGKEKTTRANCPSAHKLLIFNHLQAPEQKSRTNSICPCYFFLWFWSQNQAFSALFPIAFLPVTL